MKTKEQKRREAEARKQEYALLTNEQRLARLDQRPGKAAKERGRLT